MKPNLYRHTLTLLGAALVLVGTLVTVVLVPLADATSGEQPARVRLAMASPDDAKDGNKPNGQKHAGDPLKAKDAAPLAQPEVLCERVQFAEEVIATGDPSIGYNCELVSEKNKSTTRGYSLSSVTVPQAGWKVHSLAIYTISYQPEKWLKLRRARLNVFAKKGDLPAADADPQGGREVEVTVRRIKEGVYEVRASDLKLDLKPGEYWIGLTPISSDTVGWGSHLLVHARDARFDDVGWSPGREKGRMDGGGKWTPVFPDRVDQHLSVRIEGWYVRRGQLLDWPAEKAKDAKLLHLRFGTFDPVTDPPKVPKELSAPADGTLWIVQYRETVDEKVRGRLTQAGATLLRYLPDDAYVVRLAPDAAEAVRRLPGVRWVGPYHPAYRLDPNVFPEPEPISQSSSILTMRSQFRERRRDGWRYVLVHLFGRDEATKKAAAQAVRDGGGEVVFESPKGYYLAANVPLDKLAAVAKCDAVSAIERRFGAFEHQPPGKGGNGLPVPAKGEKGEKVLITLAQIRELCGADAVKKGGGYEGLGVRVAFWDWGVREDHVDLLARPLTVVGTGRSASAIHGTEVASILCGEGRGDPRARGLMPAGGLLFAVDNFNHVSEDRYGLVDRFVRDHRAVLLSSSSSNWGGWENVKHYDGYALLLDDLVLEYDLLMCEAIGNQTTGSGIGQCGSWSKNALLVGGVHPRGSLRREEHRPILGRGPAADGRVKPDLVHFASDVFCANASSPKGYGEFGGTSCATPLVAGHCGLMMEMWADGAFGNLPLGRTVFDRKPHAATAKALMINSAYRYPIDGEKPFFTRFNQGWGMPDVGRLYDSRKKLFVVDQELALRDRQGVEYRLHVPENEPELRATMVYTDPLGTTAAAKALVNDLDLIVIAPDGKRYFGNHGLLEGKVSREGGAPDRINNVENVFLEKPAAGVWRVLVAAHRIAWDQHRGTTAWDQDFALVVAGVVGSGGGDGVPLSVGGATAVIRVSVRRRRAGWTRGRWRSSLDDDHQVARLYLRARLH
ncbi:MAG: S8 family serine peptidase [Planctomycetia bacterium]|nr:S8 family serine peptidase [Planctomycetia bacterium]